MPFQSLILGKRLPDDVRSKMLAVLKDDFLTEWGLATEAPESPLYQEDSTGAALSGLLRRCCSMRR